MRICSDGYLDGFHQKPRIDHESLRGRSEGLICLTSNHQGEVGDDLLKGNEKKARETPGSLRRVLRQGERLPLPAVPRDAGRGDDQQALPGTAQGRRLEARGRQRRALPGKAGRRSPRRDALHRRRPQVQGRQPAPLQFGSVLPAFRRGDGRALQGLSGRPREHGAHRRAVQRHHRVRQAAPSAVPHPAGVPGFRRLPGPPVPRRPGQALPEVDPPRPVRNGCARFSTAWSSSSR